jgi:transposase InsO family protein
MVTVVGKKEVDIHLSEVLIVPSAPYNLLSVNAMMVKGVNMEGRSTSRKIVMSKGGRVVAVAEQQNGLPVLKCFVEGSKTTAAALAVQRSKAEVWHERLGHLSYGTMARMIQDEAVEGMDVSIKELKCRMSEVCDVCIKAKQAAVSHVESDSRAVQPLQLVHSDLMGPFTPASAGGNLYLMTALDDYSGYAAVKPLKHKSEATAELKMIITAWERQTERQVKAVRTDGGKEYTAFDHWCGEKGISRESTVPHTPQQNGRAERLNRTLTVQARQRPRSYADRKRQPEPDWKVGDKVSNHVKHFKLATGLCDKLREVRPLFLGPFNCLKNFCRYTMFSLSVCSSSITHMVVISHHLYKTWG